ncbi:Crp/Fnr family transcriptional regulator [Limnohabitans sp. Hippo3]|uniref:Crp/Fnr family transcriptional regulator n=1 Tax=Limnohabitans sp. Hippo3 TaxID=1597956 RepID=UPI0011B1DAD4|nr:Crp/Fnr family transcriptional regulator [Limnohabitans sp. Hippo3]
MHPNNNAVLATLPSSEYQGLQSKLTLVSLTRGQTLIDMGESPTQVYFPVGAIVSMINELPDGQTIELHMLGRTCLVGVAALDVPSFYRATVRVSGLAYRLPMSELLSLRERCPTYFIEAQKRTGLLMSHIAQRATCISYHKVEQQLVRWMILMLDRLFDDVIQVTHSELASLIGTRREAVTMALGSLARQGLIEMNRGSIRVPNRAALEMISCDCYWNALGIAHPSLRAASDRNHAQLKVLESV